MATAQDLLDKLEWNDGPGFVTMVVVVFGVIAATYRWGRKWLAHLRRWNQSSLASFTKSQKKAAADRLPVLRAQVLELAKATGQVLPASSRGQNPAVVTFSDGGVSYFFADRPTYVRLMKTPGAVDPMRAWVAPSPPTVAEWGASDLEQWLADNSA